MSGAAGHAAAAAPRRPASLRRALLLWILLPLLAIAATNAAVLYAQALRAADTAYDRTLLATAKSIGELLTVRDEGGRIRLRADVPYAALEAFEADNRSRLYFRVLDAEGRMVSGFEDLPLPPAQLPPQQVYAALVHFYDAEHRGEPVRMAVLLQPVAGVEGQTMATVQVAETLELRRTLARQLLVDTLWRQAALVGLIAVVVWFVVQRVTRPVRALSRHIVERPAGDLSPIAAPDAPPELQPLLDATNQVMGRLARLLAHQKRFVRDAAHQLRTPLAVLKAQVQSARRGDLPPEQALAEIARTIDGATALANQMLALAKVEQLRQQGLQGEAVPLLDWAEVARAVALDLAPLAAERGLDFSLDTVPAPVRAHEWPLRELVRNLLHNAIKHGRPGSALALRLQADGRHAALTVADQGPGIPAALRERLFQPFAASDAGHDLAAGSGLGLAICREIVDSLGGSLELNERQQRGRVDGVDAVVRLPLAGPESVP